MGAVEQSAVLLRETAHRHGEPEIEIAAVRQRGDDAAAGIQDLRDAVQQAARVTQVFEDVAAQDEVEDAAGVRDARLQVAFDNAHAGGSGKRVCARPFDAGHVETALCQQGRTVAVATAQVEHAPPPAVHAACVQQQSVA